MLVVIDDIFKGFESTKGRGPYRNSKQISCPVIICATINFRK